MASESPYPAGRTYLLAVVAGVVALVAFVLAFGETRRLADQMSTDAGIVALWPAVTGGFALAVMFAAVALLSLLSLRRDGAATTAKPVMAVVFAAFALTFVMPWVARGVVGNHLVRHGYVRCPTIYERPITRVRWARPPTPCPIAR